MIKLYTLSSIMTNLSLFALAYRVVTKTCSLERQNFLKQTIISVSAFLATTVDVSAASTKRIKQIQLPPEDEPSQFEDMPALRGLDYGKPRAKYPDFVNLPSGIQYKDLKVGSGDIPDVGNRVILDWEGYTIGYYGRPFQLKNSIKGGAFAGDTELLRFIIGDGTVIRGLEEAVLTMKVGGIRQVIIPNSMGYPDSDKKHNKVGPKPSTFSGNRALDFVLENTGIIDKTLLFNIELKRVDKPGQRGFGKTS